MRGDEEMRGMREMGRWGDEGDGAGKMGRDLSGS
jgi:hypothetical protein